MITAICILAVLVLYLWLHGAFVCAAVAEVLMRRKPTWRMLLWPFLWLTPLWPDRPSPWWKRRA